MAFLLEELILNFSVDTDSLERGLDSVSAKARARAREIERMAIAPKVDLSGLHELNKLLDVKQRHIRETAQFAARNPIVVKVDTVGVKNGGRDLDSFSRQVSSAKTELNNLYSNAKDFKVKGTVEVKETREIKEKTTAMKETGSHQKESNAIQKEQEKTLKEILKKTQKDGLLSSIGKGLFTGFGMNLTGSFSSGFLSTFEKKSGIDSKKLGEDAGNIIGMFSSKSVIVGILKYVKTSGVNLVENLGISDVAKKLGDSIASNLVDAIDQSETATELLVNSVTKVGESFGAVADGIDNIVDRAKKLDTYLRAFEIKSKNDVILAESPMMRAIVSPIAAPFGRAVKERREKLAQEKGVPLVAERALEIYQQNLGLEGTLDVEGWAKKAGRRTGVTKGVPNSVLIMGNKMGVDSPLAIKPETKELIITVGGYGQGEGKTGLRIAGDIALQNQREGKKNVAAIGIQNPDTDIPRSAKEQNDRLSAIIGSLGKPNLRGYNKDAIEMASQAMAALMVNPNLKIKLVGESGGGYVVEEATHLLNLLGYKDNVQGAAFGTPNFIGATNPTNFNKYIAKNREENLGYETHEVYAPMGLADVSNPSQHLIGATEHPYEGYRHLDEFQSFVFGKQGKSSKDNIVKSEDIKQIQSYISEILSTPSFITTELIDSLSQVRSQLHNAVGENEDISGLINELSSSIESVLSNDDLISAINKRANLLDQSTKIIPQNMIAGDESGRDALKSILSIVAKEEIDIITQIEKSPELLRNLLINQKKQLTDLRLSVGNLSGDPKRLKYQAIKNAAVSQSNDAYSAKDSARLMAINKDLGLFVREITDDKSFSVTDEGKSIKQELLQLKNAISKDLMAAKKTIHTYAESTTDIWSGNYDLNADIEQKIDKVKQKNKRVIQSQAESDPFVSAKFNTIKKPQLSDNLLTINSEMLAELKAIKILLSDNSKHGNSGLSTPNIPVHEGELLTDITSGLANINTNPELNAFQKTLKGTIKLIRDGYGVASGVEQFTFDLVKGLSVGLVDLKAVKRVTQTVAPAFALAALGHDLPMIGAGLDAVSGGVVTPLLSHGMGAVGSGIAGMLPESVVGAAATAGGWLSHVPGVTALSGWAGEMGGAALGGAGTGLTYLLGGNLAQKTGKFALGQAVKPLAYLNPAGSNTGNQTYNLLTGVGNYIGNAHNQFNRLTGKPVEMPMLPPRQVEYVNAEVIHPELPFVQTRALNPVKPLALPSAKNSPFKEKTVKEIEQVKELLDLAFQNDSFDVIEDIKKRTKLISNSFKEFYAELGKTIKKNQIDFARVQAMTLLSTSEVAKQEIDRMLINLKGAGLNTGLGTSGVSSSLHGLKGNLTKWEKGTNKKISEIDKLQAIDVTATISKHWDTTADHVSEKMDEIAKKAGEVGYDVQHDLSEGSPGLTQRIRDYWDKTIKHIKGKIAELNNSNVSNLEPSAYPIPQINPDIVAKIKERENELQGKAKVKGRAWQIAEAERIMAEKESQLFPITGNNINIRQKNTNKPIQQNTQVTQKIIEDNQIVNNGLDKIGLSFTSLRNQFPIIDNAIAKFNQFKNLIVSIGVAGAGAIGLFLIGKQLTNIATESVKVYRNFESIFIASKTIANGSEFLGKVRKQVKDLGGDLESTMRQGQQFVTGLQGTNLERTAETLFLDSSKALKSLGLQTQQYDSAILAIKQVASKGKVSLEEISGQLGESVPGALNIAAQAMQTNVQGFIQMVESGNLLSEEFLPKFIARLKAQTAFLEPEIKKSLNASFGRLGANYTDLQLGIGQSLSPTVAAFVNTLSNGLEFVNKNFDKAIMLAELLAISLAMPAAYQGILLIGKAWQFVTANMTVAKSAADAVNQSLLIGKTLVTGGLYVAAAASILTVIDSAMYLWEDGTKDVKDNNEAIKNSVDQIAASYAEAYGYIQKIKNESSGTGNPLLDFADGIIGKINEMRKIQNEWDKMTGRDKQPGYKPDEMFETNLSARQKQDKKNRDNSLAELQSSRWSYQKNLSNPDTINKYMKDAIALRDRIGEIQGKIAALQTQDPAGNYHQIQKLNDVLYGEKGLFTQREILNNRFVPGGETGIEQQIKLMEILKKEAQKANDDKQVKAINQELEVYKSNLARLQDLNKQLSSGINDQRLAWIEMTSTVVGFQRELEKTNNIKESKLIDSFTKRGVTSGVQLSLATSQLDYDKQQSELNRLKSTISAQEKYLNSNLEKQQRSLVESLQGKSISQFTSKDLDSLQKKIAANSNLKNAINDQVIGEIGALLENKQQLSNAELGLSKARQALLQQKQTIEDFNLELVRSIYDFNKGVEAKQSEVTGLYRDWQRRIEDSVYNNKIKVRQLSESYSDLMFNLQTQLSTSSNELINIKNQIGSEKRKQENLLISPGTDSIARQVNSIFNQLFDNLTNGEQEKRQANLDAAQVQKQYIDTLRQIRQVEEDNIEARKAQSREIEDLTSGYKSLNVKIKEMIEEISRQRQDAIKKYDREGVNVRPYLQADPNFGYNQRVPFSVPMGKPIVNQAVQPTIVINPVEPVKVQAEIVKVKNSEIPIKITPKVEAPNWNKIVGDQLPPKTQPQVNNTAKPNIIQQGITAIGNGLNAITNVLMPPAQATTLPVNNRIKIGRASLTYNQAIALINTAKKIGIDPSTLLTIMLFETAGTLDPSKTNSIGATGLIQFMPNTAKSLGTTTAKLREMTFEQQLPYVERYFKQHGFRQGMGDLEAYATVIGGNPNAKYAKDSNGTNALSGLDRMNRQHRGIAERLLNQFNLRSNIPQEWLVADASEGISDMGSAIYQTNATAQARAKQIEANKKRQREIDKQKLGSLTENWGTITEFWKQKYPESYSPEVMSKFGNKFIDTRPDSANKVQPLTKPLKIDASPAMLEKVGITKQIKESTKKAITEGVTEGFNDAVKMPDLQKQIQQVTNPQNLGIAGVPYLAPIPVNDFESAKKLADKQREVNTELAKTKSLVADEKMTTSYLEAIDNLTKLEYTLKEANLAKTRSLFDGQEELRQIARNSKGYQTAQEQNQKVGYDIWKSFEDKRRAIQDANFAEELKQKGWTVQKQKLIEDLQAKGINPAYDEQVKSSLNNLDIQMNQSKVLQQQLTIQNQQIDALAAQTVQTAMARDNEDRRLNAMKEYGDLQANLASARYNYGGELINNGAVISAQLNALQSLATAKRKVETEQFSPQQAKQYLAMTKELADVNISQSYVDAIPFLKEFSSSLKDVVLQTTNWRDALKKLLDLAASTILDQLVIKPMQNGIANLANDWGLFGNTNPINPPSNAVGIDNGNNLSSNIINAVDSISTISKVVPEVTQSFSALALSNAQNQVTEQTALMAFSASLQTATLAVMQFSAGLGGQSIVSGLIGQSVTDAASGGYTGILDIPSLFYTGSDFVPNYANGVESALSKERAMSGRKPYLAALHEGEAVLSTLNGDSALYRSLKRSGTWDELKTGDQIPNFAKGTDGGISQGSRSQSNRQGDRGGAAYTINVNQTIVTPNASSFNSSERQRNQDLMVRINKSVGR